LKIELGINPLASVVSHFGSIRAASTILSSFLLPSAQLALLAISDLMVGIMQFQTDETMQRMKI